MPNVFTKICLEIVLNTRLSAEDSAAYKAPYNAVLFKTILHGPYPQYFPPLVQNFYPPNCSAIQASHPIPRRRGIAKGAEDRSEVHERASACHV